VPPEWIAITALAVVVLALLLVLAWRFGRDGRASRRRQRRADRGEQRAQAVLKRAGYKIIDTQPRGTWPMVINGKRVDTDVRADYIVTRHRRTFVAEVKTGHKAPNPTYPPTRRQLLEYLIAYDADGVLLVDMEREAVIEVDFPQIE
jgi:hypothetical protein